MTTDQLQFSFERGGTLATCPHLEHPAVPAATQGGSANLEPPSASSPCPTCGDAVPPRARACPNCYEPRAKPKGGD